MKVWVSGAQSQTRLTLCQRDSFCSLWYLDRARWRLQESKVTTNHKASHGQKVKRETNENTWYQVISRADVALLCVLWSVGAAMWRDLKCQSSHGNLSAMTTVWFSLVLCVICMGAVGCCGLGERGGASSRPALVRYLPLGYLLVPAAHGNGPFTASLFFLSDSID